MKQWFSPTHESPQAQNAFRIALWGFVAAVVTASFYLYLALRYGNWQLYAWSADIWVLTAAVLTAGILVRRGRATAGAWLIIGAAVVTFIGAVALIEGTGVVIGVGLGILVAVIAGQTLSPKAATRAVILGVAGGIACILLDLFAPSYRLPQPEVTRAFLPGILIFIISLYGVVIARNFRDYSLRTKFLLSVFLITGVTLAVYGYFAFRSASRSQTLLSDELQATVQTQAELQLKEAAERGAHDASDAFTEVAKDLQALAVYRASLYAQTATLENTGYLAKDSLAQLAGGQYGNSPSAPGSIYIPNTIPLSDSLFDELSVTAYLDFIAPSSLEVNPNIVALYYIAKSGVTTYYPNIDLANQIPPDFDPREGLFFSLATPENNPERAPVWTPPYQDPAGMGLLVTNSIPVYDQGGKFRGVMGADVQLARITEQVANIQVVESGFAFLIDPEGHVLGMTGAGYDFFGLKPEEAPVNETPKQTVLGLGPAELQAITTKMTRGEEGLAKVSVSDAEYYLSYFPLESIGYSIGLIAPASEMEAAYVAARERAETGAERNRKTVTLLVIGVLVAVAGLSQVISQGFLRPLAQLRDTAEEIAKGNLNARARVESKDEVGVLGETLNAMTAQLRDLVGSLEQRVAQRTQALATVAEVSAAASVILETDKLLQEVTNLTKERFGFYHAHIYLLDETGDNLALAAGAGEPGRRMVTEGHSIPLDLEQSLVARAARERKGVIVNDVTQAPDFLPNPYLPDTRSELAVPMVVGENVIGVFDVQSNEMGRFTDSDADIQSTLAAQIAAAVQNSRLYTQAEAALEEVKSLVENAPEAVFIVDLTTGLFADPNEKALQLFGLSRSELEKVGPIEMSPTRQLDGSLSAEKSAEKIEEAMQGKTPVFDWMHRNAQGQELPCEVRLARLPGGHPRVRASVTDITERLRLQELTTQRARQQETLNLITQKIQSAVTVESALQIAARELGHALGMKPTLVALEPGVSSGGREKENAS